MALCLALIGDPSSGRLGAATARADTVISPDRTATDVSAFRGVLVWSRRDAATRKYRLVQRIHGLTRDVPVPGAKQSFNPDLGPDRRGRVVAVYSRCSGSFGTLCDVFQLDLRSGRERRVRGVSTKRCSETAPSIWSRGVAFSRTGGRRCRPGLYVTGRGGRPIRLQRTSPADGEVINDTDIRERTVAAGTETDFGSSVEQEILLRKFSPRRRGAGCVLRDKLTLGLSGASRSVVGPSLDAGYLYWTRAEDTASLYDFEINGFERVRTDCRAGIQIALRRPNLVGPATADGGTLYYTARPSRVLRADNPRVSFLRAPRQ
jgi:hypothetical protein